MLKRLASPIWAVLEYGWYPLLLFATTPWFLHRLGTEHYGYWMLLTATVGFGGALNTGTGAATIKAVSSAIGRGESSEVSVRASLGIAMIGGGALSLIILLTFWFGGSSLLGRMGSDTELVRLTGAAAALLLWLEQLDNVASSAMKGAERFGHAARLEIIGKTVQIGLAVLATWRQPTLTALYLALVAGAAIRLGAKLITARCLLRMSHFRPSLRGTSNILHFARWGWLQGVGGVLFGVADRLLVGSILGAASLAYYAIASQLAMQIHATCAAALSVMFPIVSRKLEEGDQFPFAKFTKIAVAVNFGLASLLSLAFLILGDPLLKMWLGPAKAEPVANILPYLVIAYWLLALNVAPHYLLLSLGKIRFVAVSNLIAGSALALVIALLAENYGLVGVAIARTFYGVIIMVNFLPLLRRLREARNT